MSASVPAPVRRIYLVGPSGHPNYGDELVAATWLRYLAEVAPDAEVWLDCHTPGTAQVMLDGLHPRLRCTDTLWRLSAEAPSDDPWQVAAWVRRTVNEPGQAPRHDAGIDLLGRLDVVHLIGGGYLNALWPHQLGLVAGAVAAGRRSGARTAMTGQGLVPTAPETVPLLRVLAEKFDVVDVRDDASAELLGPDVKGERTCDDVFLGIPEQAEVHPQARPVMVCVQSDIGELGPSALAGRLFGLLRHWAVDPADVTFVEAIPRVDRAVFDLLAAELPGAAFVPLSDMWRHGAPVVEGQTWISTRFHLHLLAAAAGASGVALSVSPEYYDVKHGSLVELGSGWTMLDAASDERPTWPDSGGFTAEVVERCAQAKAAVARRIYAEG